MIPAIGYLGVLAALIGAALLLAQGWRAARGGDEEVNLRIPALLVLTGAVVAMAALELALLVDDFSLAYVANHHRSTTPLIFAISSAWAALEGSIVMWGLVLAGFTWLVFRDHRRNPGPLSAGALAVMGAVSLFFFGLMATVANPFEVCTATAGASCVASSPFPWAEAAVVAEGRGPNPLLQNHILMAVHPPILYVGYVGMTVPFAYAISALANRLPGIEWARRTKQWTLVAWSFLTLGIVLGGWWSYEVLGWGGYWAWDPVENASFMPWLVATAFIHSSFVQMRRGMLQAWNFILVIAMFAFTILGTFLTRSGTIASVHSFTQSAVGPALLGFLAIVLAGSLALFARRSHLVSQSPRLESLASREGAFLGNNLLLTVFAFVVLIGTLFPIIVEAFTNDTVGVGSPFFDQFAIPLSFALLLAMGVGPLMPYRVARGAIVWNRVRLPIQLGLAVGALTVLLGVRDAWPILSITAAGFVMASIVTHFVSQARRSAEGREEPLGAAMLRVLRGDPGFWGGQISHLGVAILAVGIAGSGGLSSTTSVTLAPGESGTLAGYEFEYRAPFTRSDPNREVIGARLEVTSPGGGTEFIEPRTNTYTGQLQAIPTPGVATHFTGDLYFTITAIGADSVSLDVWWFPLQWMVWLGGMVAAAGGLWSSVLRRRAPSRPPQDPAVTHV